MMCSRAEPIDSLAKIDARQIAGEDLRLGQPGLEPEGDDDLLRLALHRPFVRKEARLGELLRDRRTALLDAATADIGDHGAADSPRIDAPVPVETAILYG